MASAIGYGKPELSTLLETGTFYFALTGEFSRCQGKVEMSPLVRDLSGLHVSLRVPAKRRRAMLATSPIEE